MTLLTDENDLHGCVLLDLIMVMEYIKQFITY